jgi:hypothetical protein
MILSRQHIEILLDSLALLHKTIKQREQFGLSNNSSYSLDDVDNLYLDLHSFAPYFGRLSKVLDETNI